MHAFGSRGATNNAYSLYSTTASTAHDRKRGSGGDSKLPGMKQATAFTSNFHPFSQRHLRKQDETRVQHK
ncbi:hypothetical protein DIPPA_12981 [Diplonema papillatum]|nr:hypothetical protein DIPPA_12981 [Diplonema papillatum]